MKTRPNSTNNSRKYVYNKENSNNFNHTSSIATIENMKMSNSGTTNYMECKSDSDSITSKCGKWSLGKDVGNNPPLLEDMGLSPLPENGDNLNSFKNGEKIELLQKVLQPSTQVNPNYSAVLVPNEKSEDFFVYKRRKLGNEYGEDKFNTLTEELVLQIFKHLPKFMLARCAQVCKRWKRIAFDESLWRRLDLGGKNLSPGVVGRVVLRGTCTLRLAKAEISSPIFCPQLQHISEYTPIRARLQNLDLSMAAISPEALEELFSVCFNLQKVSLEHCTVTTTCCEHLSNNSKLDTLNLAMCYGLNSEGLLPVITKCKRLLSLNLAWTHLQTRDLSIICRKFPSSLERLNLSGCRNTLNDNHIGQLCMNCPELRELDVSDASHLTAECVRTIIKNLHCLEYLAFARCFSITPDAYLELTEMPNLLFLDLYGILNEFALSAIRDSLPNIKVNKYLFSSVARPTVGIRRTSIWGLRVRD